MILSFGNKNTENIWQGLFVRNLPEEVQKIGRRKLRMLNNSQNLKDISIPPSNRLEKMKGIFSDYYSIRINDQWRIMFKWSENNTEDVFIIDYH
jgi:proteic killer suppression protein